MDIDFSNLDDIDIDKEGITRKKFNKYIVIVPTFSILVSLFVVIISFCYLIKGEYKKEKKDEEEIIINCIEGDDDYCSKCENDKCVSCNYRYDLINGTCNPTFSFKVIYETTDFNESLQLINSAHKYRILALELDNEIINIEKADLNDYVFTFGNPGNHTAYFSFNSAGLRGILTYFFSSTDNIIYVHFTKEFNTENITQLPLFFGFSKLKYVDISNFNIENLFKMENLFAECSSLTKVILPNSIAPKLNSMSYMFYNCTSLTSVSFSKGMNYSTENLINFENMFSGCISLTSIDFSYLKTTNIKNTNGMFDNCISLTSLDLSNFTTHNLEMDNMFNNCINLSYLDISNFDVPLSYDNFITNFPPKGKIRLNKNISEYIKKFLPDGWTIDIK